MRQRTKMKRKLGERADFVLPDPVKRKRRSKRGKCDEEHEV